MKSRPFHLSSILVGLSISCLIASSAMAQTTRAQIRGFVVDTSSAALPGASVTLKNVNTNLAATKTTDSGGLYVIDFVNRSNWS